MVTALAGTPPDLAPVTPPDTQEPPGGGGVTPGALRLMRG